MTKLSYKMFENGEYQRFFKESNGMNINEGTKEEELDKKYIKSELSKLNLKSETISMKIWDF